MNQKPKWKWSADTWISLGAMIIAFAGVLLTVREGNENREHNRLMVSPRVEISYDFTLQDLGFNLMSVGLGPAVVKWFEVTVDNKPQESWRETLTSLGIGNTQYGFSVPNPGLLYSVGETHPLLKLNSNSPEGHIFDSKMGEIELRLCFCSMYKDDCYITTNKSSEKNVPTSCDNVPKVKFHA